MIKPFGEYVLIELLPLDEVTEGGILLPPNPSTKYFMGKVLAVGQECKFVYTENIVIFPSQAGIRFTHRGKEHLILLEKELWGKIE